MNATRAGFAATLPWAICLGGAVFAIVRLNQRDRRPEAVVAGATLILACAGMLAMSIVWKMHAADPLTPVPAQMNALRRFVTGRAVAVDLRSLRRLPPAAAWEMGLQIPIRAGGRGGGPRGLNRPTAVYQLIPAGSYVLSAQRRGAGDGWVMVGVGNDQFAIATRPIADFDAGVRIDLPAGARMLTVRADEGARAQLVGVELRPVALDPSPPATAPPGRAVRYDGTVVFFLDEPAFPEPSDSGGSARSGRMAPDRQSGAVPLIPERTRREHRLGGVRGRREDFVLQGRRTARRGAARAGPWSRAHPHPIGVRVPAVDIDSNSRDSVSRRLRAVRRLERISQMFDRATGAASEHSERATRIGARRRAARESVSSSAFAKATGQAEGRAPRIGLEPPDCLELRPLSFSVPESRLIL